MPCNFNHRDLAAAAEAGVREAGGTPMQFSTIAISDGITMGTDGMRSSLISREVIADSIELVARGHHFDALVCVCSCDKTVPGCAMALARVNRPAVLLYGGTIMPGRFRGRRGVRGGRRRLGRPDGSWRSGRAGTGGLPGRGSVRRAVHRQYDVHGDGG